MVSFSIFSLLTWYPFIISYSSIPSFKTLTAPLHLPLSSPYKVHSNNTCFSVSTSPHRHLSSSYFHVILSLPLTGKHPPLTISLTPAPTFPSAKLSFLGHSFIFTYSFSLSVSLNPFFHTCLPTSLILLQMCFFQNSQFTFIPNFTIPFKLTSLNSCLELNLSLSVTTICGWNGLTFAEALSFIFFKHNSGQWNVEVQSDTNFPNETCIYSNRRDMIVHSDRIIKLL